jgi:hypothetical protein
VQEIESAVTLLAQNSHDYSPQSIMSSDTALARTD